jgi:oxygen-dependent protoporphyrinogen oxidase
VTRPQRADVVIVGAGIAGLSAAWELRDRDIVVLEAADRVGGRMWSEPRGPYWLNYGGHVIGGPETATGRLMQALGVEGVDLSGVLSAMAMNGRLVAGRVETFPMRLPLSNRDRLGLIRTGARLRVAAMQYARVSKLRKGEDEAARQARVLAFRDDETFADWLGEVAGGVDAIFRATVRRSTGEPEEIAAGYGIGYFQLVWDRGRGLTRNIVGGSAKLPEAIARALGDRVQTSCPVTSVSRSDDGVGVTYEADGQKHAIRARAAVVAAPAFVARDVIRDLPSDVAAALDQITYGPSVVGSFLTNERSPMPYDRLYAAATPNSSFNMFFNMANSLRDGGDREEPGGSIMVYGASNLARELGSLSDVQIEQRFLNDLYELFPPLRGNVEEAVIKRWPNAAPHCRPGRSLAQPALVRPIGPIQLAGDYLGITYIETAIHTAVTAASRIRRTLDDQPHCGAIPGKTKPPTPVR